MSKHNDAEIVNIRSVIKLSIAFHMDMFTVYQGSLEQSGGRKASNILW